MNEQIEKALFNAAEKFDLNMLKIDMFTESVAREHEINLKMSEAKVVKESGTQDDLNYLYEEADKKMVDSIVKAIEKILDMLMNFFSDLRDNAIEEITTKTNKEAISKISKKVALNPILRAKKVKIEDIDTLNRINNEAYSQLLVLKAKLKSGQKIEVEDITKIQAEYKKKRANHTGVAGAKDCTLKQALKVADDLSGKMRKVFNDAEKKAKKDCQDLLTIAKTVDDPGAAEKLASAFADVSKNIGQDYMHAYTSTISTIKSAISGSKSSAVAEATINTSGTTEANDSSTSDPVTTPASQSNDPEVKKMAQEINKNSSTATEDGDEEILGEDPADSLADPWDNIITGMGDDDESMIPSNPFYNGGALEATATELFGQGSAKNKAVEDEYKVKGHPDNEKIVADLYASLKNKALGTMFDTNQTGAIPKNAPDLLQEQSGDNNESEGSLATEMAEFEAELDKLLNS